MAGLTIVGVKNAKPGRYADGGGLYLLVKPPAAQAKARGEKVGPRSWVLRVQVEGRRRDIGLGSVDLDGRRDAVDSELPILSRRILTLAEAREKAGLLLRIAKAGRDPVTERDRERIAVPTFADAAKSCHTDLASGWAPKNAKSFLQSLEDHAFPKLGRIRVDHIESSHLRDMLAPIWTTKPEMARKVRQRAGVVLNYAKAKGWRAAEAPGKSVTMGLARHKAGGNFAAMPYADVPTFVADLNSKTETIGRLALLFTIYTAARSGEARQARWDQIDVERKLWIRPGDIMKGGVAHTVTLSEGAVAILTRAARLRTSTKSDAFIFPSVKGTALSDMALSKIMRDAKIAYVPHGFRSSFRDFAAEQMPTIPDPVAEAALAHVVPDKVERAYKRTDFLEMRRKLLNGWADYLAGTDKVVRLAATA